jgi:hypothetical protein
VFPDGLAHRHLQGNEGWLKHASPVSVAVLGAVLLLALSGLLGGSGDAEISAFAPDADLVVTTPTTVRNGVFFETLIEVRAKRDFGELVLAVEPSLWRDVTQNSMLPAAADESFEDGRFRYSYGKVEAGRSLTVKIDSQINPSLVAGDEGTVAVLDGDRKVAEVSVPMRVLP